MGLQRESNPKVLIIEDDAIIALELKSKLEMWGYEVPAAASFGREAIEIAENNDIDLILADIIIKGEMDGVETVSRISEIIEVPPVLYLTANTDDETYRRAKVTKPFGFIYKPYDDAELKFNIEIALHKKSVNKNKELTELKERLSIINNFILSFTPILNSNVHIEDKKTFLTAFIQLFKDNIKSYLEKEMESLEEQDTEELFNNYLKWISKFYNNLGYRAEIGYDEFKISQCIWGSRTRDDEIFCMMCRAMADLTFRWTNVDGWVEHEYKMGVNPPICRFKYKFS